MPSDSQGPGEEDRLAYVRSLKILDTPIEERFERITRLLRRVIGVPMAGISIIDDRRQWFKSFQGGDLTETPREQAFCNHTIKAPDPLVVSDAMSDVRFKDLPLVTGAPHIGSYAGVPLTLADGIRVGTLCVLDTRPRVFTDEEIDFLKDLAETVATEMKARILRDLYR